MIHKALGFLVLFTLLSLVGCATLPAGPTVRVLPAPGKPFEQFMNEDAVCRDWAARSIGETPEEIASHSTAKGAAVGTLIGAGAGAALGAAAGNPGAGAAIGGGTGLLFGSASGSNYGRVYGDEAQRRYDNTYVQCMYAKGNQVPGVRVRGKSRSYNRTRSQSVPPDYNQVPPDYKEVPPDYKPAPSPAPPERKAPPNYAPPPM